MSLIKKIKQFINGSWKEFSLNSSALDNVVTLDGEQSISGNKTWSGENLFQGFSMGGGLEGTQIGIDGVTIDNAYGHAFLDPMSLNLNGTVYTPDSILMNDYTQTLTIPKTTGTIATQEWVNGVITGKVDYLGTVASIDELATVINNAIDPTPGDYCRASSTFTLLNDTEVIHVGDILIYKSNGEVTENIPSAANWDIIHTEDPGNYVTLNTDQTITGKKTFDAESTFNSSVFIKNYDGSRTTALDGMVLALPKANGDNLVISASNIMIDDSVSGMQSGEGPKFPVLNFPTKSGTFALLSDIPTNYVTTDTDQTITGKKTFTNLAVDQNVMASSVISFRSYYEDPAYPENSSSITVNISPTGLIIANHKNSSTIYSVDMIRPANGSYGIRIPSADISGDYFATRNWTTKNTVPSSTIDQEFFNLLY